MKKIEILGTGCPKCQKLYDAALAAVDASGAEASVEKVTKIDEIAARGVMATPALVIDGKVVASGRAPGADEIAKMLA